MSTTTSNPATSSQAVCRLLGGPGRRTPVAAPTMKLPALLSCNGASATLASGAMHLPLPSAA